MIKCTRCDCNTTHDYIAQVESDDVCLDCITQDEDDQLQWEQAEARLEQFLDAQGEGQ